VENDVENLVAVFIILTSVFIAIQVGVLAGVFVSIRRLVFNVERLRTDVEEKVEPTITDFKEVLVEAKDLLSSVRGAAENFASISESVKYQVERVTAVIEDTTDRARIQISKADEVVTDAIQKMEATSEIVHDNILVPVSEVAAIIRGVSSGLQFLFARRKNAVDQVHQDEELFI
jgi:methyl-accepting chemotaxis protein